MANERAQDTQEEGRTSQQEARTARQEARASGASGGSREQHGVARRESAQPATSSPFTLMRRFMEDLDRLFVGEAPDANWAPAVEVVERDGRLVVRADVPGLEKDNVNVEIDDGQLVISGERRQEHEERREGLYRSERVYGRFYRAIPLPDGADAEHATATFKNGVVEIGMPMTGRRQPRRVQVQDASSASAAG